MTRKFEPRFEIPKSAILNPFSIEHPGIISWKNKNNGFDVAVIHYTADPDKRTEEWFLEETRNLREDQIRKEYEIDFTSQAGQKVFWYLEQFKHKYIIDDIQLNKVPKHWRIIAGLDYGSTNPTSIQLFGIDENRKFHTLLEFYKPSTDGVSIIKEIIQFLKGTHPDYPHPLWRRVEKVMCDPSIFKNDQQEPLKEEKYSIADLIRDSGKGIPILYRATNSRIAGLERVKEMLNYLPNNETWEPNLVFCRRCRNTWREFTNLVYDEIAPHLMMEKNQIEDVKKKDDHAYDSCFASNTKITTIDGHKNIQDISVGDFVLTRSGYKKVTASGPTNVSKTILLYFENGKSLNCTENHPIFTLNRGFVRADSLTNEDVFLCESVLLSGKKLNSMVLNLEGIRIQKDQTTDFIINATQITLKKALDTFIEKFGKVTTGTFLLDSKYITKTETHSTTKYRILNALKKKITFNNIEKKFPRESSNIGKIQKQQKRHALIAALNLKHIFHMLGSALAPVGGGHIQGTVRLKKRKDYIVQQTYNLSVEDKPEYFANGILVHNCRYALMSIDAPAKEHEEPIPQHGSLGWIEKQMEEKIFVDDEDTFY